ncbi:MAG TPA: hypothetical protein VIK27_04720 [Candidatus Aquilonibacter sp.]
MKRPHLGIAFLFIAALAACGGGGGSTSLPQPTPSVAPSVSGDMMALKASQGWNYHATSQGTSLTLTTYADPNLVNGVQSLIASSVLGLVPTVATSAANMTANLIGAVGFSIDASKDYNAVSELSVGSLATIPGSPLLVPSTLTLGQTWTPYAGVGAQVINVGAVPNSSACGAGAQTGAQVKYTYGNLNYTIAYVPGCGITDFLNNANGAEFKLISTQSYASIGQLARGRDVASATLLDTAASLLGQRRSVMPAAKLVRAFFP